MALGSFPIGLLSLLAPHLGADPIRPAEPAVELLDRSRFDFRDDRDGRLIGEIEARLERRDGRAVLEIRVSADGPLVEPPPGFTHRQGSNRYTAEELETLLEEGRLLARTRGAPGGEGPPARAREARRGRILERRLLPGGRIDYHSPSRREHLLEATITSPREGEGLRRTEVAIEGVPRLAFVTEIAGRRGRILGIEGLAADPARVEEAPPDGVRAAVLPFRIAADADTPLPPPPGVEDWEERDIEGRWVLLKKILEEDPAPGKAWVRFLAARKEFELLEWLAVYDPRTVHTLGVAQALLEADAPQWIRVAVWCLQAADSHAAETAEGKLLLSRPAAALAWLKRHPQAVQGPVVRIREELERIDPPLADVSTALPPLESGEVFARLAAPPAVEELGDRKRAEAGKVYLHQVLREIDGAVARQPSGTLGPPDAALRASLLALTRHPYEPLRRAAHLAHSRLPPELIPMEDFARAAADASEPAAVREAALLALSYSRHPRVYLTLHHVLADAAHPAWKAAASRLGDLGDGFTLKLLAEAPPRGLDGERAAFLEKETARIRARVAKVEERGTEMLLAVLTERLERAAWADLECDPLETTLVPWTLDSVRKHRTDPRVRQALEGLRAGYTAAFRAESRIGSLERRVRQYAAALLE